MVIIISHVQAHFSHLPAAAYRGRSNQSIVTKHAGKKAPRVNHLGGGRYSTLEKMICYNEDRAWLITDESMNI